MRGGDPPAAAKSPLCNIPITKLLPAERPHRTVTSVDVVPMGLLRASTKSPLRL